MLIWRLVKSKHQHTAFSGIGSKLAGGRWTPIGVSAVYTSESPSLAMAEMLVHMETVHFKADYLLIPADLPDNIEILMLHEKKLPANWRNTYEDPKLQTIGKQWIESGASAVICVPSAVMPLEYNYILNPEHPDFEHIEILEAIPFDFDERLRR
ncbi:MAG TPA: RES domain-containing protein [Gammaproteobacteria bacterium]|nr:RES domain-containing protein [Gammaproteobacteria bacterium]